MWFTCNPAGYKTIRSGLKWRLCDARLSGAPPRWAANPLCPPRSSVGQMLTRSWGSGAVRMGWAVRGRLDLHLLVGAVGRCCARCGLWTANEHMDPPV